MMGSSELGRRMPTPIPMAMPTGQARQMINQGALHMRDKGQSGYTLVEVVISSGIMALALSGFIASFVMSQRSAVLANRRMEACHIARQNMETVICSGYFNPSVSAGTHTFDPVTNNNCVFRSWYVVTQNATYYGIKDIQLAVSWVNPTAVATNTIVLCNSLSMGLHP